MPGGPPTPAHDPRGDPRPVPSPTPTPPPRPRQPPPTEGVQLAPNVRVREAALVFTYVASPGPGGQNVNKRATKAQLRLALADLALPPAAEARLRALAGGTLTDAGDLLIASDEHRSQRRNRDACLERLADLVRRAMIAPKRRKATKPTRGSVERRLSEKQRRGDTKRLRRDPD